MSDKNSKRAILGPKAMEQVMRDVLGGMEDLAIMKSFESMNNVFEIVSILSHDHDTHAHQPEQNGTRKADVIPIDRSDRDKLK